MRHSIWIGPWDLAGRDPAELIAFLRASGLDACNLALSYHGGRMVLPENRRHTVYELHPGAVYFPADASRYAPPLAPAIASEAPLAMEFVAACRREAFPVRAWTVLCHNDYLGSLSPEHTVRNAFGERYSYALCPSHPEVRRYAATLCGGIAALDGVEGLDLEALGFLGYTHASLHDKSGVTLAPETVRALSICFCPHCREAMGPGAEEIAGAARDCVRAQFRGEPPRALPGEEPVLAARRAAQLAMLDDIRRACGRVPLDLRVSSDPWFFGGKSTLGWRDLAGRADRVTMTFFHLPVGAIPMPAERTLPLRLGFVFHGPDCAREEEFQARYRLLRGAAPEEIAFYSFSMATRRHFEWLRREVIGQGCAPAHAG